MSTPDQTLGTRSAHGWPSVKLNGSLSCSCRHAI